MDIGCVRCPRLPRRLPATALILVLGAVSVASARASVRLQLGRSYDGRPILAIRAGNPEGTRALVVGCIHGTECAGIAVARALERVRARIDLWIVPNLNPDGYAAGTRQNIRPRVMIWFHQDMNLVWAFGPSTSAGRIYARAAGMRFYHHHWLDGAATNWQNHHLSGSAAFTVELSAGSLSSAQMRRQVRAVVTLAAALRGRPGTSSRGSG